MIDRRMHLHFIERGDPVARADAPPDAVDRGFVMRPVSEAPDGTVAEWIVSDHIDGQFVTVVCYADRQPTPAEQVQLNISARQYAEQRVRQGRPATAFSQRPNLPRR